MSEFEQKQIDDFLVSKKSKLEEDTINYTKQLLALELQIKEIKDDMKVIKSEAKAEGVDTAKVGKAITALKKTLKAKPADLFEEEKIFEIIENNESIVNDVRMLIKVD